MSNLKQFEIYKNGTAQGTLFAKNKTEAKRKVFATYGEHREVEEVEELPNNVQEILIAFGEIDTYDRCNELLEVLRPHGFEFDYYLDAQPYNLRRIE